MIINPFLSEEKVNEESNINKSENKKIDIVKIQQYLIDNFINELKNENKLLLKKEIQQYLYNKYNVKDINIVNDISERIFDKMFGYGILQKYIENKNISDIRVVNYKDIYIKSKGNWKKENISFKDNKEFYDYVKYCILKNGSNINYDTPIVIVCDKKYNLRIEAGISPVNTISPSIVIRIHHIDQDITLEKLAFKYQMMDFNIYNFLNTIINKDKSIIIAGKGGSGKTTILRGIINKISENKSISINEETTELYISNKNVIEREVSTNRHQKITLETLTKHSLVMSNDVIVIGEIKGSESLAFLDGISTGHVGLATVHSNGINNTMDRLITLVKKDIRAQQYSEKFIQKIISSSIDYIIYMKDYKVETIADLKNKNNKLEFNNFYKIQYKNDDIFDFIINYIEGDKDV